MRLLITLAVCLGTMVGCASHGYMKPSDEFKRTSSEYKPEVAQTANTRSGETAGSADRMITCQATVRLQCLHSDSVHNEVMALGTKYGGYVLESGDGSTSIRIPSTAFNACLADVYELGEIVSKEIQGQDVTEQYHDLKTRLDNAERTRLRYLELLNLARTIEETLRVERELERINQQIELYKGRIEKLSHLVSYSTITVNTTPQLKPGPVGFVAERLYKGIKWLFVRN